MAEGNKEWLVMSYEDLIFSCRKLVALDGVFDELLSMGIYNENNCEAFTKEIVYLIKRIKEQCEEVSQ